MSYPHQLGHESPLVGGRPDMLDDGMRVHDVEFPVLEREVASVGLDDGDAGKRGAKRLWPIQHHGTWSA